MATYDENIPRKIYFVYLTIIMHTQLGSQPIA